MHSVVILLVYVETTELLLLHVETQFKYLCVSVCVSVYVHKYVPLVSLVTSWLCSQNSVYW